MFAVVAAFRVRTPELIRRLTLIDSQLSGITWSDRFINNDMSLPNTGHPTFDRAALVTSATANGMGVALETTRLAERELSRGDLVISLRRRVRKVSRETHFLSSHEDEHSVEKVKRYWFWLLKAADLQNASLPD